MNKKVLSLGFDYALTHGSIVCLYADYSYDVLLSYSRKTDKQERYVINYKDDLPETGNIQYKLQNLSVDFIDEYKHHFYDSEMFHVSMAVDFSPHVYFNRMQAAQTGYAIGILETLINFDSDLQDYSERGAVGLNIVSPAMIREYAGLKRNEKKEIVQRWYLESTELEKHKHLLTLSKKDAKLREDEIDALILAYYIGKNR